MRIIDTANIKSTQQTSSVARVARLENNTITLGTTTYSFPFELRNNTGINSQGTLAIIDSEQHLNFGYNHAQITVLLRGTNLGTPSMATVNEIIFMQTSQNPTAVNNLPTQAQVQYVGEVIYLDAEVAQTIARERGYFFGDTDNSNDANFSLTVDFSNRGRQMNGIVTDLDNNEIGTLTGNRGTGNNANKFTLTYTGNQESYITSATIDGGFYGTNAAELSGVGRETATGLPPALIAIIGEQSASDNVDSSNEDGRG